MSTIEERFRNNEDIKELGGEYILKDDNERDMVLRSLQENAKKRLIARMEKDNCKADVYVGFINNTQVNAFAMKDEDSYYIGIYLGAIDELHRIHASLLNNTGVLDVLGVDKNNFDEITKCLVELEFLGFIFLVSHECNHINNGHLDFLSNKYSMPLIFEVDNKSIPREISFLDSQTLEYDADACGISNMFSDIYNAYMFKIDIGLEITMKNMYNILYSTVYSIYVFLRLLEDDFSLSEIENRSHPFLAMRMQSIFATIATGLSSMNNLELPIEEIGEILLRVINSVEGIEHSPLIVLYTNKVAWEHMKKVHNNWANVRPLLLPYCKRNDLAKFEELTLKFPLGE